MKIDITALAIIFILLWGLSGFLFIITGITNHFIAHSNIYDTIHETLGWVVLIMFLLSAITIIIAKSKE